MTKDEALQMCLEYIETNAHERRHVRWAIKDALAQPLLPMQPTEKEKISRQMTSEIVAARTLAQPPLPVQKPEYWNVIDPAGNIVASETDAIRGWARIAGSYKPTVEGLLGLHEQGWRVLPKVTPPMPEQERNFCPRCGKRTADLTTIHTCTPPRNAA